MSIDRCSRCGRLIDTDFDLECYVPDPRHSLAWHPDICVCESCREREEAEQISMMIRDEAEDEAKIIEFPPTAQDQQIGDGSKRL